MARGYGKMDYCVQDRMDFGPSIISSERMTLALYITFQWEGETLHDASYV